jgi:cobalamin biosynthesis Mg chelatase CobN
MSYGMTPSSPSLHPPQARRVGVFSTTNKTNRALARNTRRSVSPVVIGVILALIAVLFIYFMAR